MRGIIGVIDGTHVEIVAPPITDLHHPPFAYINRKARYSVNVMVISDSKCKRLGVNPGSVHDSAVWHMSNVRQHLLTEYNNEARNSYLIGYSGYSFEPWLLTPFAQFHEGSSEAAYNAILKSTRNVNERTNYVLKAIFRCLSQQRMLHYHLAKTADIIYTCCILHNIAINNRLAFKEVEMDNFYGNIEPHDDNLQDADLFNLGREIRNNYITANINV